jgi:hypothetical protein
MLYLFGIALQIAHRYYSSAHVGPPFGQNGEPIIRFIPKSVVIFGQSSCHHLLDPYKN